MYVSDLALDDFRSYDELVLALEPGPTAFIGPNGQGKTNLVEAIAYLSTLSSHRSGADTALVRRAASGEPQPGGAVVRAKVVHGERPSVLEIEIIAGRANRARLNRTASRPRALLGILRAVVFAPEDLALVREEPGVRRRFMDDLAVTLRPSLAGVRAEHDKILAQRASLLKSARAARRSGGVPASMLSSLEVWDAQLAAAAARLVAARVDVVARLRPWVMSSYERVSQGQSSARLVYRSSLLVHEGRSEPDPADEGAGGIGADVHRPELGQRAQRGLLSEFASERLASQGRDDLEGQDVGSDPMRVISEAATRISTRVTEVGERMHKR